MKELVKQAWIEALVPFASNGGMIETYAGREAMKVIKRKALDEANAYEAEQQKAKAKVRRKRTPLPKDSYFDDIHAYLDTTIKSGGK